MNRVPQVRVLAAIFATSVALALAAMPAFGATERAGRDLAWYKVPGTDLDGISATLNATDAHPASGHCFYMSVSANDNGGFYGNQVQTGILWCSAGLLCMGSSTPLKFVETAVAGTYTCFPHGAYNHNAVSFRVARTSSGSSRMYAFIGGVQDESNPNIPASGTPRLDTWTENSPSGACGASTLYVADLKREVFGSGTFTLDGYPLDSPTGQTCVTSTKLGSGYYKFTS